MKTNSTFFSFVKVSAILLLFFLLFFKISLAQTAEVTPNTLTESNQSFTYSGDCSPNTTDQLDFIIFNPNGIPTGGNTINCSNPTTDFSIFYNDLSSFDGWIAEPGVFGTWTILADNLSNPCVTQWDGVTDELTNCLTQYSALGTFTLSADSTGGGSYTPPSFSLIKPGEPGLLASVATPLTDGVQETGKAIWPMFAFVGVLLAFIIALQMVVFLRRSVGTPQKNTKRSILDIPSDVDSRDRRAYRRGRKIIEKEIPDFYED